MIVEVDHPTLGRARQIGSMVKLSESPFQVRNWSQRFGQHTEEILRDLGYSKEDIDRLREIEVIG
jgi:crotonobetainyl-CoA:carnitine CoA-transferase CaiB-like acyl-CoA transferase